MLSGSDSISYSKALKLFYRQAFKVKVSLSERKYTALLSDTWELSGERSHSAHVVSFYQLLPGRHVCQMLRCGYGTQHGNQAAAH